MKVQSHPVAVGFVVGVWTMVAWVLIVLHGCGGAQRAPAPPPDNSDLAVSIALTCVNHDGKSGTLGYGSGVVVGEHHVLTARHVVMCEGMGVATITDNRGNTYVGMLEREWKDHDVARVVIAEPFAGWRRPRIGLLKDHDLLTFTSQPVRSRKAGELRGVDRVTCREENPKTGSHYWCSDFVSGMLIDKGNSGSPVYDATGALVGLVTGARLIAPREGYGTSLWEIRDEVLPQCRTRRLPASTR